MTEHSLNDSLDSYSLLFDKSKHNFSTSSEIILSPSIDNNNQTIIKELENLNPFLLLFTQDDEQQINKIQTKYDDEITQWTNPRQGPLNIKTPVNNQQHQSKK